jgi:hypothetical protein
MMPSPRRNVEAASHWERRANDEFRMTNGLVAPPGHSSFVINIRIGVNLTNGFLESNFFTFHNLRLSFSRASDRI